MPSLRSLAHHPARAGPAKYRHRGFAASAWDGILSQQIILLIQEDPANALSVREALSNSIDGCFKVEWLRGCQEGLDRLAREGNQRGDRIAAILVDLFLPDSRGIDTFDSLYHAAPQIPILVLSSSQDEDIAKLAISSRRVSTVTYYQRL